jgi:N-acetylmuramic acid 6-phosphate (MurNAc-6-P) etherase
MTEQNILSLLRIKPSAQSSDYVQNKKQFQLHSLLTEQRHPKTWDVSYVIKQDIKEGLEQIFSVDRDISQTFKELTADISLYEQAIRAIVRAITEGKKIFVYGCGSTGRLAKQMESAVWRPFWNKLKTKSDVWDKLKDSIPADVEERLIGEMTGGDRALISALEGFEDLKLVGKLQLRDRGVEKGDAVFCITEGGETSSVIGAILEALDQYGELTRDTSQDAREHLYFIYNNPDEVLLPFDRSRVVLENPVITKINLTTGPQAITGSTRMQAATAETFVLGTILEFGIREFLKNFLSDEELFKLGFTQKTDCRERLRKFEDITNFLIDSLENIECLTALESSTYQRGNFVTYYANDALITVFIDCAERSPTFHLHPLDTVYDKKRNCWLQVWTEGDDLHDAWQNFLGRDFCGLEEKFYRPHFLNDIEDVYLREAAMHSLSQAGYNQKEFYDFSFAERNIKTRGPQQGDLGICVCIDEEIDSLALKDSPSQQFVRLFKDNSASLGLILVGDRDSNTVERLIRSLNLSADKDIVIHLELPRAGDPLNINRQILIKMLLNGHSTAVMAWLGRVVGNTMTHVNPSNLKLIGRATYLIESHVNDIILSGLWRQRYGNTAPVRYKEANAILFDAMEFVTEHGAQISEVELSIIRILETLAKNQYISWEEAAFVQKDIGLEGFIEQYMPNFGRNK